MNNAAVTEQTDPVAFRPDNDGGMVIFDVGNRRAIHLTEKGLNRLIAATGRRLSPSKARMMRFQIRPKKPYECPPNGPKPPKAHNGA
jgi:hypothetical protein